MNKKVLFPLVGVIFSGFIGLMIFGLFYASDPHEIPSNLIGTNARDFHVVTFNGQEINLSDFRGQPVIVNFWASWCISCRQEAKIVEAAYQKYRDQGAVFIGLAINDERSASLRFIRKYGKTYLLAPDDLIGTISLNYGVTAAPETFFIDTKGVIQDKAMGPVRPGQIDKFLDKELAKQ